MVFQRIRRGDATEVLLCKLSVANLPHRDLTWKQLLDVGTKPLKSSFYTFYNAFERNAQVAGVCGEITTRNKKTDFNPVVSAQHFEYKVASRLFVFTIYWI